MLERLITLISFAILAVPVFSSPVLTIAGATVTAQGLTPGSGAILFSVAHEPHLAHYTIRRVATYVADDNNDGVVSFTAAADVPWNAVWLVVDAHTGAHAAATRDGSSERVSGERRTLSKKDAAGEWSLLTHERSWLELLVVRPGDGAWVLTAMRGGTADVDRKGGTLFDTPIELFAGITPRAKQLKHVKKGDVVLAIDPDRVEYFIVEVE